MSATAIIDELPHLSPDELVLIKDKVDEALKSRGPTADDDFLIRVAGSAEGLPPDLAANHDHYLYGLPRRREE